MNFQGLCYICSAPSLHSCRICGGLVCDEHYAGDRLCIVCESKFMKRRKMIM